MELHVIKEDQELTHIALAGRLDLPGVQSIEKAFSEHAEGEGSPRWLISPKWPSWAPRAYGCS